MANKIQWQSMLWLVAILTAVSTSVFAQRAPSSTNSLPDYFPASYQQTGVIHEIGVYDTLIISGLKYQLSSITKIHTVNTQFATPWSLKSGEEVGFSFTTDAANNRSISEIWLLPNGTVVLH